MPTTAAQVYRRHPEQSEIDDVLAARGVTALGTLNDDGSIHLTYLLFLYEDGRFFLETASSTRKAQNVAARRVAADPGDGLDWAVVDGRVRGIRPDHPGARGACGEPPHPVEVPGPRCRGRGRRRVGSVRRRLDRGRAGAVAIVDRRRVRPDDPGVDRSRLRGHLEARLSDGSGRLSSRPASGPRALPASRAAGRARSAHPRVS